MITVLIADDEAPARDELQFLLEQIAGVKVVGLARNGREAVAQISALRPQVVFLDIQMPDMTGIAVARELLSCIGLKQLPVIIFATAYDTHAIEAFEVCATDYVLKPFSMDRLKGTMERVQTSIAKSEIEVDKIDRIIQLLETEPRQQSKLAVEENERIILIAPEEIVYCSVSGRTTLVKTVDKQYSCSFSLAELEQKFNLLRTHKSYLVNKQQIREIIPWFNGTFNLVMGDKEHSEVPVSRSFTKQLKSELQI